MINWRTVPFFRLLIPLVLGIVLCEILSTEFWWKILGVLGGVALVGVLWLANKKTAYNKRFQFGIVVNVLLVVLGFLITTLHSELLYKNHFSKLLQADEKAYVEGSISAISSTEKYRKIELSVDSFSYDSLRFYAVSGQLLIYLPLDANSHELGIGDQLALGAKIFSIRGASNPLMFDFAHYWHLKNTHYQAFLNTPQWRSAKGREWNLWAMSHKAQQYLVAILRKHLPTPKEFALAAALITGYKGALSDELREVYSATGSIHVLAVSGLHTGFVYMAILFLLGRLRIKGRWWTIVKLLLVLFGLWSFAFVTGSSPSVLRAATMFSVLAVGRFLNRDTSIYNSLCVSAFLLLCVNPYLLFQPGFQLSYLAVVAIVYFQPLIYKLWYIAFRPGNYIWQLVSVSFAAQVTTFPLTVYYFHRLPVYFWLSGLIVVPAASIILPLGLLLFCVDGIPWVGDFVGMLLYGIVWIMNAMVYLIEQLPNGVIEGLWINKWGLGLLYLAVLALVVVIESREKYWLYIGLSCIVFVLGINSYWSVRSLSQASTVVYAIPKERAIDVFSGQVVYSYSSASLLESKLLFAADNLRLSKKINNVVSERLDSPVLLEAHNNKLGFYNEKNLPNEKVVVDYLLLGIPSQSTTLAKIQEYYSFKVLVIDGVTPAWIARKWEEKYSEQVAIHNTWTGGALWLE